MSHPRIILKKGRDKAVRARHPWIFSGAIDRVEGEPAPGATVEVQARNGDHLGFGAWSPQSQIQVRLWNSDKTAIDHDFFRNRIETAISLRQGLGIDRHCTAWRILNAESDGLPGLVADKIGDWVIVQFLSAGAEPWKQDIAALLHELTACKGVYERSDVAVRHKEGLTETTGVLLGEAPPDIIDIEENGRKYRVDVINGHKTGFYLDQRDNRSLVSRYAKDKEVLNCFSYTGGFGIAAARGGALHVTNIDSSAASLELAQQAATLNNIEAERIENICADVFTQLRKYRDEGKQFDLIVLDPPKFAENRNQLKKAARAYKDINLLGFKLLRPGGLLFTFSCSGLMDPMLFQKIVADAALDADTSATIIHKLSQASDHPTRLSFPEGLYLKGLTCMTSPAPS